MKKYIRIGSIILIAFSVLYAEESVCKTITPKVATPTITKPSIRGNPPKIKIKVKVARGIDSMVKVKFQLFHDMLTKAQAKYKDIEQNPLATIVVQEDGVDVFVLKSTEYFSKNPIFKFNYKSLGGDVVTVITEDSNGETTSFTNTKEVQVLQRVLGVGTFMEKKNTYSKISNDKELKQHFPQTSFLQTEKMQLLAPRVSSNGAAVPVRFKSMIPLKKVSIFASEEEGKLKFVGELSMPTKSIEYFAWKMKLNPFGLIGNPIVHTSGFVVVVAEGLDGLFYMVEVNIIIAMGGSED